MVRRDLFSKLALVVLAIVVSAVVGCSSGKVPAPTAAFSVTCASGDLLVSEEYIAGTAPLTIRFTDQSSGEITSWRWSLGDGTVVEGGSEESRDFTHTYGTPNSSGYIITLTVRGPGGKDQKVESGIITVFSCSEAANWELNQARTAIRSCLSASGKSALDSSESAWDGSRGKVTAGGRDAADYLGIWKTFKAMYNVEQSGTITSGTDASWGCVFWDPAGMLGKGGWRAK